MACIEIGQNERLVRKQVSPREFPSGARRLVRGT